MPAVIRKPRHGWTYAIDRTVAAIMLFLSFTNLITDHHLWCIAWLGISLGATAHARLERLERRATQDAP